MIRLSPAALHGLAALPITAAILALPACAPRQPMTRHDAATIAACRQRAEQIYTQQNRAEMFSNDQTNSPFGASGVTGVTSTGLGQRFGYDTNVSNCIRNSEAQTEAAPTGGAPAPAAPPPVRVLRMPPSQ
jgi:hypothetical protein